MKTIEYVMLAILTCLGVLATVSDIREGVIRNRMIAIFMSIAVVLDIVYYIFFAREMVLYFAINVVLVIIICLILFFTHSLAGGDCKLIPVMVLLYPAGGYLIYKNSLITMFFSVCFAILYGYIYLFVTALIRIFSGKTKIEEKNIKSFLLNYLKSYGIAYAYISLVNMCLSIVGRYVFSIPKVVVLAVCFAVAWASGKIKILRKIPSLIIVICITIVLASIFKILPVSLNPGTYIFTAFLILCQMTIRTVLYDTIKTEEVKKGMILSLFSSMLMQNSRIADLPAVSTEDLRSRLTEKEADSVRRWGQSKKGHKEITIVRKIPFAVFILLGFTTYFLIWSVLK